MRLFIGLRPPAPIRDTLQATMHGVTGARWQDDDQLHVTLRFIGEVSDRVAEDIADGLRSIVAPPLAVRLDGVGVFAKRGRPGALWAGVTPAEPLAHLHRKVDRTLVAMGLPPEGRAYLPHITLARLNGGSGPVESWLGVHANLSSPAFTVADFLLFESILGRAGATYNAIARYPLRG